MYKQLTGRLRDIQVVLKEALDGKQRLVVQGLDRAALKDLFEEHFAQGRRQLIDQTRNAQIVIADDGALRIEHLADLQSNLRLFKGTGQILDANYNGADADHAMRIKFAGEGIHNGTGQLFQVLRFNARPDLLDQRNVRLVDVDDKILALIREEVLDHIVSGNIGLVCNLNQHADPADVGIKAQFPRFQINIAGKDIVQDHVFNKVAAVILFIVVLFDAAQRDGKQRCIPAGFRV